MYQLSYRLLQGYHFSRPRKAVDLSLPHAPATMA
jgi:hypothetical protein